MISGFLPATAPSGWTLRNFSTGTSNCSGLSTQISSAKSLRYLLTLPPIVPMYGHNWVGSSVALGKSWAASSTLWQPAPRQPGPRAVISSQLLSGFPDNGTPASLTGSCHDKNCFYFCEQTEKHFSDKHSTLVNDAYKTLQAPLTRGLYLVR